MDGRIVEANEAAISGYQYDRNTLLSMHVADLRIPSEKSRVAQQLADARQRGVRFETVHRRAEAPSFLWKSFPTPS